MNQIVAKEFLAAWALLEPQIVKAGAKRGQVATESERDDLINALCAFEYQCRQLGLIQSRNLCGKFLNQLKDQAWHHDEALRQARIKGLPRPPMPKEVPLPGFETVYAQLRAIAENAYVEMDSIRLTAIWPDKARFFERDDLFDKAFHAKAPPKINAEIKAAGNCLAADLNTAAVFHLMRTVEYGLRALAADVKVPIDKEELEYKDWSKILEQVEAKIKDIVKCDKPHVSAKEKSEIREFYNGVLQEFNGFKDRWRNHVMHTRGIYMEGEVVAVLDRVRIFMETLATRVPLV